MGPARPRERSEPPEVHGPADLTGREREVMGLVADRMTNAEIAESLVISRRTVESHVSSLLRKFGVTRRADLISAWWAAERGPNRSGHPPVGSLPEPLNRLLTGAFIGRSAELSTLHEAFARARARRPQFALVRGETGIGKSRLLAEFGASLGRGATVRLGRCDDQPGPPYLPIAEIIRSDVRERSDKELDGLVGRDATGLVALVPDLGGRLHRVDRDGEHSGAGDRRSLFEAVRGYLSRVADLRPLVVVLEDVHWADDDVIALVRHLSRDLQSAPVLTLISARSDDVPGSRFGWFAELRRVPEFTEIELRGLSHSAVVSLLRATGREEADELGHWLHQRSDGNPFFTLELLRSLDRGDEDPSPEARDVAGPPVPPAVLDLVQERLSRLPEPTQRLLEWAAVLGTDFGVDTLAAVLASDAARILDQLEAAERAGVIRPHPDLPGTFQFSHALVRDASLEPLPASPRMKMHAAVAHVLLRRHRVGDASTAAALAHHLYSAGPVGDWRQSAAYSRQAGHVSDKAHAHEEAARHYGRALEALLHVSDRDLHDECGLRVELGEAQRRSGSPHHRDVLLAAAAFAVQIDEPTQLADAVLAMVPGGWTSLVGRPDPEVGALAERALAGLSAADAARRVRLTSLLAADAAFTGDQARARELATRALDDARQTADPALVAFALLRCYWVNWDPEDIDARRRILDEVVDLGLELRDAELTVYSLACRVDALIESADLDSAITDLEVLERRAEHTHEALYRWLGPQKRSGLALLRGDLELAERLGDEALRVGRAANSPVVHATWAAQRCLIRLEQHRAAEAVDLASTCADQQPAFPAWRALHGLLLVHSGRTEEAQRAHRSVVAAIARHPRNNTWRSGMHCAGSTAIALGDRQSAGLIYDLLLPSRGVLDWVGGASFGPTDLVLGRIARFLGSSEELARAHLQDSVATCRRLGAGIYLARSVDELSTIRTDQIAANSASRRHHRAGRCEVGDNCRLCRSPGSMPID